MRLKYSNNNDDNNNKKKTNPLSFSSNSSVERLSLSDFRLLQSLPIPQLGHFGSEKNRKEHTRLVK